MKTILKTLILSLFISLFFAPQVQAAENRDDWCDPIFEQEACKAQQKVRSWWPWEWLGVCKGDFIPVNSDWCSNEVELQGISIEGAKDGYFNPGDTVSLKMNWKNNTGGSITPERKVQISGPDYNESQSRSTEVSFIKVVSSFHFKLPQNAKEGTYTVKGFLIWNKTTYTIDPVTFQVGQAPQEDIVKAQQDMIDLLQKRCIGLLDWSDNSPQAEKCRETVSECVHEQKTLEDIKNVEGSCQARGREAGKQVAQTGEVTLKKVYAAIGDDIYKEKNNFTPDDSVELCVFWENKTGDRVNQRIMFKVLDSELNEKHSNHKDEKTAEKEIVSCSTWIQKGKATGEYTVVGWLNGVPNEEKATFKVKAAEVDKKDQSGQGIVVTKANIVYLKGASEPVFIPGDTLGILVFYRNFTGREAKISYIPQVFKGTKMINGFNVPALENLSSKDEELYFGVLSVIPKTMEAGNYTVKVLIKYQDNNGQEKEILSESMPFEIKGASGATDDKKTQVATTTQAYIHGVKEGAFDYLDLTENWISVGSLTWADSEQSECLKGPGPNSVELIFSKVDGGQEQNIQVSNFPVYLGNELKGDVHSNHKTCWSYKAELPAGMSKQGKYRLTAKYVGNDYYKPSDSTVEVEFTGEKATVKTITIVSTPGVQGVAVKKEGDQIKLLKEGGSEEVIILTPQSSVLGGVCNQDEIPLVHFTVVKVAKDGSTEVIYDNPTYPNCEPYTLYVYELDDLDEIDRIEASANLPNDPESDYAPSQGGVTIKVSEEVSQVAEAETYVHLGSNPLEDNIKLGDNVWVFATTNKAVQNPLFKVIRNGEEYIMAANSSNNACQFKATTCQYSFIIFQVDGDYDISFENDGALDSLSFNTQTKPVGQIASVGLLINGEEIPLSMEGGFINLHLDGLPTNSFLIVIHYTDGTELRKSLVFEYSPETPPPALPEGGPPAGGDDESGPRCEEVHIRNECAGCNESQKVYQQYCYGDIISGDPYAGERQYDSACSSWCSGGGSGGNTCAYTESFNCTGQNGGCGSGSGEMRKTIINTDCSESSVSYCDGACAPSGGECDDVRYCDENISRIIHKHGYWDDGCQYAYDREEEC